MIPKNPQTPETARTTYERAVREYDDEFKRHLIEEIITAVAKASIVTDCNVMALRTGETVEALIVCLISFAAMSPHFDTPSHLREFAESTAKRIRREVGKARAEGFYEDFVFGARKGGTA
jgi:hypothetical protein